MTRVDALSRVDMSFFTILIPFEEPPHLTADLSLQKKLDTSTELALPAADVRCNPSLESEDRTLVASTGSEA